MKNVRSTIILFSISFAFAVAVFGQTQPTTEPDIEDNEVVKITTSLVQVDAVVTDKDGNQITDLSTDDLEIFQDGKLQKITNFSFVNTESPITAKPPTNAKNNPKASVAPTVASRPSGLARVITFVIDDGNCAVTLTGMRMAKEGLEKFVNEQMRPDDLVGIYQTRRGSSLLQQHTSDKVRLLNIVRKIRWYPPGGICPGTGEDYERSRNDSTLKGEGIQTFESPEDRERKEAADNFTRDNETSGTIGVLRYAINGLRRIGGRKTLFLLTDSLPISNGKSTFFNSYGSVRDLTELANRASVVINTIDVRGLPAPGAQAFDDFGIKQNPNAVEETIASRQLGDDSRQSGLYFAANETGGKFYKNRNDLDAPIREALEREKGYYLIGYQPEDGTFKGKKFNKIEIKLKRPELVVSSRSGFNSLTDKELRPKTRTGDSELYAAIVAPLSTSGLDIRITAFFANSAAEGNFVKTLLSLDGNQLTFIDEPNGMKKAVFDVIAVTFNEKNEVIDEFNRKHTVKFPAKELEKVQQNGLVYSADVPVKNAGVYNFRVAVRDETSKLLGSAGQQIDVPKLKKNNVYLSGLTLGEVLIEDEKPILPSVEKTEDGFSAVFDTSNPAIRRFRAGVVLGYQYKIYNAQIAKTSQKPDLSMQLILFKDGQAVLNQPPQPIALEPQTDLTRIFDYGYLQLPPKTQPGDYILQIVIKDLQTKETSSQSIDFEVVQ